MGKRESSTRQPRRIKFSKAVIVAVLLSVVAFTVTMIAVFIQTGAVPDTLIASFFAFAGGEAGVLGLIRYGDAKYPGAGDDSDDGAAG